MNSLILISPDRVSGFQPILSGNKLSGTHRQSLRIIYKVCGDFRPC
ncbi:hypothetical protein [Microcoleus sp. CAWBG58]|nr:hypothetical protein [Microcoleus sp. CAWBG58]